MRAFILKYRICFIVEILCILIVTLMCFQEDSIVHTEHFLIEKDMETRGEEFSILPGVYQVRGQLDCPKDVSVFINVESDNSAYQSMRCNGMTAQNQKEFTFDVYVFGEQEEAYVQIEVENLESGIVKGTIELYRTNLGARMVLFLLSICFIFLDAVLFLRERILEGKMNGRQQIVFWSLCLTILLAYFPYLVDYFFLGSENAFHLLRIEGIKDSLLQGGQFPVRIQSGWMFDHGYPVSLYISDLFLCIPVALRMIGFSIMTSYKVFVFLQVVLMTLVSYYAFSRCLKGNTYGSMLGCMIYVLSPLGLDSLYQGGRLDNYMSLIFLPLFFLGVYELLRKEANIKDASWHLVLGLSAILHSHVMIAIFSVGIFLACCMFFWKRFLRREVYHTCIKGFMVFLMLNLWFIYPLLRVHFMEGFSIKTLMDTTVGRNPFYQVSIFLVGSFLFFYILRIWSDRKKWKQNPYDVQMMFLGAATICTEIFDGYLLSFSQFFCAVMGVFGVPWMQEEWKQFNMEEQKRKFCDIGVFLTIYFIIVVSSMHHVNEIVYQAEVVKLYNIENMGTIFLNEGAYLLEEARGVDIGYHEPLVSEGTVLENYEKNGLNVTCYVENISNEEGEIVLPMYAYPGYAVQGSEDGNHLPYIRNEVGEHGDLRIAIPAGYKGGIKVWYQGFFTDHVAEMVSVITIVFLLGRIRYRRRLGWIKAKKVS